MSCKSIRFHLTPNLGSILNRIDCKKNLNLLSNKKNEQDIHNNLNDEFNDDTSDYISCFENQDQHLFSYKLNLTKDDSTNLNSKCNQNNLKFDLNYLKLDSYDRKIFSAQDERDAMQKKTFTKWINKYLNEIGKDIDDLYEDLRDGTNLIILLQILTKKTFTKEKGNSKFHSLQNIRTCLDFLKNNKLKLVNIHSEDIFYGNPKITLGLVWILISYFQISADGMQKDEMNAQQALLNWCYENLKGYDSVRIKDFSSSWRDGKALIAILNRHRPDKISFNDSYLRSNLENLRVAFEFAENEFGVTKLLDPEDVDTDHPDEKSILTYVSMLFNAIPNVPMHPAEIQLETQKKQLMDEYSSICKSLMRWLRDSISTMDNRTVPKSLFEVKNLLSDIRNFRLEEYSIRLKEKKHLINLFNEMTSLPNSESLDLDNELSSIEKVWAKFDNYIQLRENLLEKTYKKYENLQTVILRIEKNSENCEKILNSIESELNQATNKVLLNGHLKSFNDRLSENFLKCDQEIRKIFADCQQLIDEEHNEADIHYKKAESIQNRSLELKSKISNYQQNFKNSIEIEIHRENLDFDSKINWLEKQKSILQERNFPSEFDEIQSEIIKTKQVQEDLNQFRNDYLKDFENEKNQDQFKYCLNELEILYNFAYSLTNQRLKLLNQYHDFVKQINDEIFFLDQKEQLELNRDWSNPSKLDSSNLKQYKKNLDYELERRLVVNVNPLKLLAQTIINENHPAAGHIKTYTDTMLEHFNWVNELSYLLSIHLNHLIDYENFKNEHKKLCDQTEQLRNNLNDIISKSNHKNYEDSIKKLDKMGMEIVGLTAKFDGLSKKTKSLNSFQQRKQKLNPPGNKCRILINYRKSQINLNKNEECIIEDNSQKTKWKIRKCDSDQSFYVPSVCLTIVSPNEEILDLIQQIKIKIDSLPKQVMSYRLQFKKDRLFNIMNKIKICDFDEYEQKRKSADSNSNFDLMLSNVKCEIEELIKQSNDLNTNNRQNQHFIEFSKNDIKLLIDNYDSCCKKLNEFSNKSAEKNQCQKFEEKFHSDLECLELKLKYLMEKFAKIQQYELKYSNCNKIIDQILSEYLVCK